MPGPVLITGCSSGVGRATALRLARSGHLVYATARRPETLTGLAAYGCRTLRLDVTDETSAREAVEKIEAEHGPVSALVNNAGYAEIAPAELLSPYRLRRQFETNLFGPLLLTQLVLPAMRAAGTGRIVNIGSIGDRCVFPLWGGYTASKHALLALTDALRMETAGLGIEVIHVELGVFATNFSSAMNANVADHPQDQADYVPQIAGFRDLLQGFIADEQATPSLRARLFRRLSRDPDLAARVIAAAVTAPRPRARYRTPAHAHLAFFARALLPDRQWDRTVRSLFLGPRAARRPR